MIAEGIVFDKPFDISKYTKDEIISRYSPYYYESSSIPIGATSDNVELDLVEEEVVLNDMKIVKIRSEKLSTIANLYLTTGIFDVICPKLLRVDLLQSKVMLFTYPRFGDDPDYSKKIEDTVQELFRVSLFFAEECGKNLTLWKTKLKNYVDTYITFVDRKDILGEEGAKDERKVIVKRIYKKII